MRKNRAALSVACLLWTAGASSQSPPPGVPILADSMTVAEYAAECQHSGKKPNPAARNRACVDYIKMVQAAVWRAKQTAACDKALREDGAPGPIMDVLFYMAVSPETRHLQLGRAAADAVLLQAQACK
jgi:hypothetical protein